MFIGIVGFMFGTGGSALVGKTSGEGKPEKAIAISPPRTPPPPRRTAAGRR
ncbi:MAG: hypothetical protein J6T13_09710 [Bacteroidales bacterium]|nr:hypothetical protein [Bacteroidales bacterium]